MDIVSTFWSRCFLLTLLAVGISSDAHECKDFEFDCRDDSLARCIPLAWKCNGDKDCQSGRDEELCSPNFHSNRNCGSNEIRCSDGGMCISRAWTCDGDKDCPNGEDEADCIVSDKCLDNQFYCPVRDTCLDIAFMCDKSTECPGASEENSYCNCSDTNVFLCRDKQRCLPVSKVCDGAKHCLDGSDEGDKCEVNCTLDCGAKHKCYETPTGPKCHCSLGYKEEGATCIDINECKTFGYNRCDHYCSNTEGGYNCTCAESYLIEDNFFCKTDDTSSPKLFYTHDNDIREIDLHSGVRKQIISGDTVTIAVTYDPLEDFIYWSTSAYIVYYMSRGTDDTPHIFLKKDISLIHDLKMDWLGRNLYLADSDNGQMIVCSVSKAKTCFSLFSTPVYPRTMVLDLKRRRMYWTDLKVKKIFYSNMDGSGMDVLIKERLSKPNSIGIDSIMNTLYWMDAGTGKIEVYDLEKGVRNVVPESGVGSPYSMAVWEDKMFWSDWKNKCIYSANKRDGSNFTKLIDHIYEINGISVFHHQMIREAGESSCKWAGCSHLCLITAHSDNFKCACPSELKLSDDHKTCIGFPHEVSLMIGDAKDLYQVKERKFTDHVLKKVERTRNVLIVSDLDYDPSTSKLYICDKGAGRILMIDMKSVGHAKVIVDNILNPSGIAVDWTRENLYWVDSHKSKLGVVNLAGSQLFRASLPLDIKCRGLDVAISRRSGQLVLACDSPRGKIIICTRSGSPCHVLASGIRSPLGLSIDQRSSLGDTVYWTDSYADLVHAVSLDGTNKRTVTFKDPASVLFSHGRVFITKVADHNSFYELEKGDHFRAMDLRQGYFKNSRDHMALTEIGWKDTRPIRDVNFCKSALCNQLCLEDQYQRVKCYCENGKLLDTHGKCVPKDCGEDYFTCISDGECFPETFKCDGVPNCDDESDEFKCSENSCEAEEEFQCKLYGKCISMDKRCDGVSDCYDQSDESDCSDKSCHTGFSPCSDGFGCYLTAHKCSGYYPECKDQSDQTDCPPCSNAEFTCVMGYGCFPEESICNNITDCWDGSDERNCSLACPPGNLKCGSDDSCIDEEKLCNGVLECPHGDDEILEVCVNDHNECPQYGGQCTMSCKQEEFSCESGRQCIASFLQCDGIAQCLDASDERFCEVILPSAVNGSGLAKVGNEYINGCRRQDYKCPTGDCIHGYWVCNGEDNCIDGGDESSKCRVCENGGGCQQLCTPFPTERKCYCRHGYKLSNDLVSCEDIDECKVDDPCNHYCLNYIGIGKYQCSCLPGYILDSDSKTCKRVDGTNPVQFIISGNNLNWFGRASLRMSGMILMPPGLSTYKMVYVEKNKNILLLHPSGTLASVSSNQLVWTPLMTNLQMPTAIDVDSASGNIYLAQYINGTTGTLMVCSSETYICRYIFEEKNAVVSAIAVATYERKLFFCVKSVTLNRAKIVRCNMDGSSPVFIAQKNMKSCDEITVDEPKKKVYWVDGHKSQIFSVRWSGHSQSLYKTLQTSVKSLDVVSHWVQWLQKDGYLQRCKKKSSDECLPVKITNTSVVLAPVDKAALPYGFGACSSNTCLNLCLPTSNSSLCVCDDPTQSGCWQPPKPISSCHDSPCSPNGNCVFGGDKFVCRCNEGYSGPLCTTQTPVATANATVTTVLCLLFAAVLLAAVFWYFRYKRALLPLAWWNKKSNRSNQMAFPNPAFGASKLEIDASLHGKGHPKPASQDASRACVALNADLRITADGQIPESVKFSQAL